MLSGRFGHEDVPENIDRLLGEAAEGGRPPFRSPPVKTIIKHTIVDDLVVLDLHLSPTDLEKLKADVGGRGVVVRLMGGEPGAEPGVDR
jgi:hypothetical protein